MKFFDTHAHCDDKRFESEYEGGTHGVITDCLNDNVSQIINIGTNLENSKVSVELTEKYENVYASVGIHPSDVFYKDADKAIEIIEELSKSPKAVAIGEIGLDYHYEDIPHDLQAIYFEKQMALAQRLNLPVIIHDRDAHGDCLEMIKKFPSVRGVFHSFSGSAEMAMELVKLGWYISFSGTVTFKNAKKPKEACVCVPLDRILIETDAPYLAPTPQRGELNRSSFVQLTATEIATLRGISLEELQAATTENAKRLFGIK